MSSSRPYSLSYSVYVQKNLECICSELPISNIKWICLRIYRLPNSQNLVHFFNELSDSLSKANESYENVIVVGDFNIDIGISNSDHDKLEQFCSLFNLQSLIKKKLALQKHINHLLI